MWLSGGKQPIFGDARAYLYHSNGALRDTFRQTAVHNTPTLAGSSSSRPSGPFSWATKANAGLIDLENGAVMRVVTEHDGYVPRFGVRHRQIVEFDRCARITIVDEVLGPSDAKEVTVSFLLDPTCEANLEGDGSILVSSGGRLLACESGPAQSRDCSRRTEFKSRVDSTILWSANSDQSGSFRRYPRKAIDYCDHTPLSTGGAASFSSLRFFER